MDAWERDKVCLKFGEIDIECTVEAQAGRYRADNLGYKSVKILEAGTWYVQVASADVKDGFVIDEECAIRVLNGAVGR